MKIAILVTHLLGAGHLTRAVALARSFEVAGHRAMVISGGFPAPHIPVDGLTFHQLAPVRSDGADFKVLLDRNGNAAGPDLYSERREKLVGIIQDFAPDVLITELFPFGRRQLAAEFISALEATPNSLTCASIRDILSPPSTQKKAFLTSELLDQYYDAVLVHSDPEITTLEQSWPVDKTVKSRMHYTGFIDGKAVFPARERGNMVVVSAGGGAVGQTLYRAALDAAQHMPQHDWLLLVGGHDATAECTRLNAGAPRNARAMSACPEFRQLLVGAGASVSMCGYNTTLDLLAAGVPSVIVPFDANGETEQSLRAEGLAKMPGFSILRMGQLNGGNIAHHVRAVMDAQDRPKAQIALNGAEETVRIVEYLAGAYH